MTGRSPPETPERATQSDQIGKGKKGGGGNDGGGGLNPCTIHFQSTLTSPNPTLAGKIGASTVFAVEIARTTLRGQVVPSLVAKLGSQVAGTIDDIRSSDVIECIGKGFKYKATVLRATGGDILVAVSNA